MKFIFYPLCFLLTLLMVSCQAPVTPQGLTVKVERVASGQALEISGSGNGEAPLLPQVRLIGIEAPDLKQQPWGNQAKQRLAQLTSGQSVLLELDVEDKYCYKDRCRQLAYVWRAGELLNEQLVKEGYVLFVPRSPNAKYNRRLATAQEWARLSGRGIWDPKQPLRQTPAEFRRENP